MCWLTCLVYNVKMKGAGGWAHELVAAPFGDKVYLYPINFLMQMIEFAAKTISHGMRLFGNMYAGELIFLLIALMGGAYASMGPVGYGLLALGHCDCRLRLGRVPLDHHHAASLRVHDVDAGLHRPGARRALISPKFPQAVFPQPFLSSPFKESSWKSLALLLSPLV